MSPSTSPSSTPSRLSFTALSPDILLLVFAHSSPFDLATLEACSKDVRDFVSKHSTVLYANAQRGFAVGKSRPLPLKPVISSKGNFSEAAYATFIFGGGTCDNCSLPTDKLPCQYALRLRSCSKVCTRNLYDASTCHIRCYTNDDYKIEPWSDWLPFWRVFSEEHGREIVGYLSKDVDRAVVERACAMRRDIELLQQHRITPRDEKTLNKEIEIRKQDLPVLVKNAKLLDAWAHNYFKQKKLCEDDNIEFIRLMGRVDNQRSSTLVRCPLVARLLAAFSRDLVKITTPVWALNYHQICQEYRAVKSGTLVPHKLTDDDKIRCQWCPKMFKRIGMPLHVVDAHPDKNPDELIVKPAHMEGKRHCPECPGSYKAYSEIGMRDHYRMHHPAAAPPPDNTEKKRCPLPPTRQTRKYNLNTTTGDACLPFASKRAQTTKSRRLEMAAQRVIGASTCSFKLCSPGVLYTVP
ncbi:hypothetical protein MKEN_00308800 [Mycena kentingensis (nom. inval.)]|nr:hypothetical protein MKEN_00308800 [Mycena kentingensis (nom. inval.)]